jgi:hypothetical protein
MPSRPPPPRFKKRTDDPRTCAFRGQIPTGRPACTGASRGLVTQQELNATPFGKNRDALTSEPRVHARIAAERTQPVIPEPQRYGST